MFFKCKTPSCPYVKSLQDADISDLIHKDCEVHFSFVSGSETFTAPDGSIQIASYFEIEADLEEKRNKKFQCLSERFGEENTTLFKKRTDTNPFVEWELTPDIVYGLNSCVQKLESHSDEFYDILLPILDDANHTDAFALHNLSASINEVWEIFISCRLRLDKQSNNEYKTSFR